MEIKSAKRTVILIGGGVSGLWRGYLNHVQSGCDLTPVKGDLVGDCFLSCHTELIDYMEKGDENTSIDSGRMGEEGTGPTLGD